MSAIFGLIQRDSRPLATTDLDPMRVAMERRGPDGFSTSVSPDQQAAFGRLLFANTPEALHDTQPSYEAERGILFVAQGRIDNRSELAPMLGLSDRTDVSDTEFIQRAYLKWEGEHLERLLGDWSLAAWHERERRFFLARDPNGFTSMHFWSDDQQIAFSTSKHGLLAHPAAPRQLNLERYLLSAALIAEDARSTCHRNIFRLRSAHSLEIEEGRETERCYFDVADVPQVAYRSIGEAAEAMNAALEAATIARLRTRDRVSLMLSGGLDSGAIASFAAPVIASRGDSLLGLSQIPHYAHPPRGDERDLIAETVRHVGGIESHLFDFAEHCPIRGADRFFEILQEHPGMFPNAFWNLALYEIAPRMGASVLLTGWRGNGSISWDAGPRPTFGVFIRKHFGRARLRRLFSKREAETAIGLRLFQPEVIERYRLRERLLAERTGDPVQGRELELELGRGALLGIQSEIAAHQGISLRDPTTDLRVLEIVLGMNHALFHDRALIRTAMKERLPDTVRLNRQRGKQSADLIARMISQREQIDAILSAARDSKLARETFDMAWLKGFAREALDHHDAPEIGGLLLNSIACVRGIDLLR